MNENDIEQMAIGFFKNLGYEYLNGADIAPDGQRPERDSYQSVLLKDRLVEAVASINLTIDHSYYQEGFKTLERIQSTDLLENNQLFHEYLTEGVPITQKVDGDERGDRLKLIDFSNPDNNDFAVVNQFSVMENNTTKRPDLVLFINGLPLVVIELKNATSENTTIQSAYHQIETYKTTIPGLFNYNAFNVISDGLDARAGTLSASLTRFMAWKQKADQNSSQSHLVSGLEVLINGMLNPSTFLDLIRYFIVFEKNKSEEAKTGVIRINTVKKLAAYHQYYAVTRAVDSTLRASGYANDVDGQADHRGGVVWHTQGSGKSLSMVFYTGKIIQALSNPTILVITDRNDLDDQLFDTFAASSQLLRQAPQQAADRQDLKDKLKVASGGVIFSTIQKFQPDEGNVYECLSQRENIIVIADEAHRTQYGFSAKMVDEKDVDGKVIGKKMYAFQEVQVEGLF